MPNDLTDFRFRPNLQTGVMLPWRLIDANNGDRPAECPLEKERAPTVGDLGAIIPFHRAPEDIADDMETAPNPYGYSISMVTVYHTPLLL
jgi:hypothetical protein